MRAQAERDILSELENEASEELITVPEKHENMTSGQEWDQVDLIVENIAFEDWDTLHTEYN